MKNWFEIDKNGLAKILERKGKEFAMFELIQNAWDENTKNVHVVLQRAEPGSPFCYLAVADDNPAGFANIAHAFTLFAESGKKEKADKRGRFNLGEKLVLALCKKACITTTTGSVIFDEQGRSTSKKSTDSGTQFSGLIRMTQAEEKACRDAFFNLIAPVGITTTFNSEALPAALLLKSMLHELPTEIADAEGNLRRSRRAAAIEIYQRQNAAQTGWLYEMGIPVVELECRWNVNVTQKIPLSFDRDNVPPSYISLIRALVLNLMKDEIAPVDVNNTWVKDALQSNADKLSDETVTRVMQIKFGDKRVIYDPSDAEANSIAMSEGYTVVHGKQLSAQEWDAVRRSGAIKPAGQVTPSPKPFSPDGAPVDLVERDNWTPAMHRVAEYIKEIAPFVIRRMVEVEFTLDRGWKFSACYGAQRMIINAGALGKSWLTGPIKDINRLVIHELAHEYEADHFSHGFHSACCKIGGALTELALVRPEIFQPLMKKERDAA